MKMLREILVKRQLINYPYLLLYLPYNIVSKDIIYASARRIADRYKSRRLIYKKLFIQIYRKSCTMKRISYHIVRIKHQYASARRIADRYNLKLVTFSWDVRKEKQADKTLFFTSPSDPQESC